MLPLFDPITREQTVSDCQDLQDINLRPFDEYVLTNDIDCSETTTWNPVDEVYRGFEPIEDFSGVLDGDGYNVFGLYINVPNSWGMAPISNTEDSAQIYDINFVGNNITGYGNVSGLVAYARDNTFIDSVTVSGVQYGNYTNGGIVSNIDMGEDDEISITNSSVDTEFYGGIGSSPYQWGGLVGENISIGGLLTLSGNDVIALMDNNDTSFTFGGLIGRTELYEGGYISIIENTTDGGMLCTHTCGGLIGGIEYDWDGVHEREALEVVASSSNMDLSGIQIQGGLIGSYEGNGFDTDIYRSNFTGSIQATAGLSGGLIGVTIATGHTPIIDIDESFVEADIFTEGSEVGGFIGVAGSATRTNIANSYFNGNINAYIEFAGGMIGRAYSETNITRSYAAGSINADFGYVGGLIGAMASGELVNNFSAALISGGGNAGGLIGSVDYEDILEGSNYLDATRSQSDCGWCFLVNTQENPDSDYFFNNTYNPPFGDGEGGVSSWEFPDIWHTRLNNYPTLTPLSDPQILCEESSVTATSINVACDVYPAGWGVTTWEMEYSVLGSDTWQTVNLADVHYATATVGNLQPGTDYQVRFRFTNDFGTSEWGRIDAQTSAASTTSTGGGAAPKATKKSANITYADADAEEEQTTVEPETKVLLNEFAEFFSGGKQISLKLGQVIYFMVGGQEHSATVKEIGQGYVIVTLASTPQDVRLELRQTIRHDVTGDGQDDIQITLNGIKDGLADLSFMAVGRSAENDNVVKATKPSRAIQTTVILVGLGIIFIVIKRGRTNQITPKE